MPKGIREFGPAFPCGHLREDNPKIQKHIYWHKDLGREVMYLTLVCRCLSQDWRKRLAKERARKMAIEVSVIAG